MGPTQLWRDIYVVSENCYVGVGVKCGEKWNDKAEFSDIKFKLLVRGSVF
jgi:hypothetical protein